MTTYYVTKGGSNSNDGLGPGDGNAWLTPAFAYTQMSAGDELKVGDGTYTDPLSSLPDGSAGAGDTKINTISAAGGVIFTGAFGSSSSAQRKEYKGLRHHANAQRDFLGTRIKVKETEFKGGPSGGSSMSVVIGTSDSTPGATFMLLEDCWVHGYGGRYKILVYNAEDIIVRRCVTRFDGSDADVGEPMANVTLYDSRRVEVQNHIAIDPTTPAAEYVSNYYNVMNGTTSTPNDNKHFRGCILIDPERIGYFGANEGVGSAATNCSWVDCASVGGTWGISQLKGTSIIYRRLTLIDGSQSGFGIFGGSTDIDDCIIADFTGDAFNSGSGSNCVGYNNGDNAGTTVIAVYSNGLLYPARIETGSTLASGGTFGQRGANIRNKIGVSGTLYGETDYNADTGESLWPWPNEARIKKEMCTDVSVTRGFGSASSLTAYIMNQFGNGNPYASGGGGGGGLTALHESAGFGGMEPQTNPLTVSRW